MMRHAAVGTPEQVHKQLTAFAERTRADELMLAPASTRREDRLRTVNLIEAPTD
jgi:alkanesulfonate monooxygenase SsuD/methylene tetrahydromethanopterin reductase-like flavin-dependent oxidoreductase (luciferase family)